MDNFYACVALLVATSLALSQSSPCQYSAQQTYTTRCGLFNWDTCARYRTVVRKRSCCSTSSSHPSGTCSSGSCPSGTSCRQCEDCSECRSGNNYPSQCPPKCFGEFACPNGGNCERTDYCSGCNVGYGPPRCSPLCFGSTSCLHGGTCVRPNYCDNCNGGYVPPRCNPVCNPSCLNGGTCTAPNTCQCRTGYTTPTCTPVCNPSCLNGGTCIAPNQCSCRTGYSTPRCSDINECADNPSVCHINAYCTNTPGSHTCTCRVGYTGDGVTCTDVNECTGSNGCHMNADCTNIPGSYTCTCTAGYTGDGVQCTDVNECTGSNGCHMNADCTNTAGSYTCTCTAGYTGDGVQCTDNEPPQFQAGTCPSDIDEVAGAGMAVKMVTWINPSASDTTGVAPTIVCTPPSGSDFMIGTQDVICTATDAAGNQATPSCIFEVAITDYNECENNPSVCHINAYCTNTPGSHTCTCRAGYTGNGVTCTECDDGKYGLNCAFECSCVSRGTCNKVTGQCTCDPIPGFEHAVCDKDDFQMSLTRADGMTAPVHDTQANDDVELICTVNVLPVDLVGSVLIRYLDGNEYPTTLDSNQHVYRRTVMDVHPRDSGDYTCHTKIQLRPSDSIRDKTSVYSLSVVDLDECATNMYQCDVYANCVNENMDGGYRCECIPGYRFAADGVTCEDIDECTDVTVMHNCVMNADCASVPGGFICTCKHGFFGTGDVSCQVCNQGNYGLGCNEVCTCVAPVPALNDVVCNNVNGRCSCNQEFSGKACDKRDLNVMLTSDPYPVLDTQGVDNITLICSVNLHSRDLESVDITFQDGTGIPGTTFSNPSEGRYERTLYNISLADSATYRCTATTRINGVPLTKHRNVTLNVLAPGRIISVTEKVEAELGETVVVDCIVYADAAPTITWYDPDSVEIVNDDMKYSVSSSTDVDQGRLTSSLSVKNLTRTDNGNYKCETQNDLTDEVDQRFAEVVVLEVPEVGLVAATPVSSEAINATWVVTYDGNLPFTCIVNYREDPSGIWMESTPGPSQQSQSHQITGLEAFTLYSIQVTCRNRVGYGIPSVLITSVTTKQAAPSAPLNPEVTAVTSESLTVAWEEPEMKRGTIAFYRVSVEGVVETYQTPGPGNPAPLSLLVSGLNPFTNYSLIVTAFNEEDLVLLMGEDSVRITAKTAEFNECVSNPCLNGGTCVDALNSFSCTCSPGWTGSNCGININECASNPCLNGGNCVDAANAYSCSCSPGWIGLTCDINAVDCSPISCLNGGTCVDGVNSFTCTCLAGYTGSRCDHDIDECLSSPCMNGATCVDEVNRFSCTCPRGFGGVTCATDIEPPMVTGCPFDTSIPVTTPSSRVTHSWTPPRFTDNSGPPTGSFGCSSTGYNECHQSGSGLFGVGITKVMYNATDGTRNRVECSFAVKVTVVDIVCSMNLSVLASPGDTRSSVDWNEPVITGWDGPTNFSSTSLPGTDVFLIGTHEVNYTQHFEAKYNVVLECSFFVSVGGQCDVNITHDSTLNRTIKWQPTVAGQTAQSFERCTLSTINAGKPIAVRDCLEVDPPLYFEWESNYTLLGCGEAFQPTVGDVADQVEVTEGNAEEVANFIANQTQGNSATGDEDVEIKDVANILVNIAEAGSGDPEVTDAVVKTVNNILVNQNTNDDLTDNNGVSSSAIVQSVEAQISSTLQQEGMVSIQQPSLHVEGVSLNPMQANGGFSFVSVRSEESASGSLEGTEVKTFDSTSDIPEDIEVVASIKLPQNIGEILQSATGDNSSQLQASFIVYAGHDLFQSSLIRGNSSIKVAGPVVSLTIEGLDLVNLTEPLVIELQVPNNATSHANTSFKCVFWDFTKADGVGDWSTAGCILARQTDNTVSCNCDHATNFAILVDVKGQKITDIKFVQALDVISQIGVILSIIALGVTLIIYLSIKELRSGKSRLIFINFCASLLLLYIVFLVGIDSARGSVGACAFVAALLHYFVLTTMMWMAVEARHMYVSTVKVFPGAILKYMLKACLIAWGTPAILVAISLAWASRNYGSEHYCFIHPGVPMYLTLLAPIGLILLHNIITFILVMRSLLKVEEESRSQQISKRLQNAICISTLMGLTWVFGFLAIGDATFAFQLIFCLTNSLQGVVVCIMFCIRRKEVRTAMEPFWRRICCDRIYRLPVIGGGGDTQGVELNTPSTFSQNTAQFDLSVSGQE